MRKLTEAIAAPKSFIAIPGAGHIARGPPEILPEANMWIMQVAR